MGLVVNFTGNVVTDFPAGSGVFIAADATNDVFFTNGGVLNPTGWNIHDVRFAYDAASDTAYFGKGARVGSGYVTNSGAVGFCGPPHTSTLELFRVHDVIARVATPGIAVTVVWTLLSPFMISLVAGC